MGTVYDCWLTSVKSVLQKSFGTFQAQTLKTAALYHRRIAADDDCCRKGVKNVSTEQSRTEHCDSEAKCTAINLPTKFMLWTNSGKHSRKQFERLRLPLRVRGGGSRAWL